MSGETNTVRQAGDRRAARRAATRAEILDAARALMAERGLAALSLRDLGERVGMRAQSLYSYVDSKHDIYDALFRQGYEEYAAAMAEAEATAPRRADPRAYARHLAHAHVAWCLDDPVRYQLLFWRTIPGFVPSEESWTAALAAFEALREPLARVGLGDPAQVDLTTALFSGLTSQQLTNDPGGDRWTRLVDRAVDLLLLSVSDDPGSSQPSATT
jgi:AcrR family transcriptional regulator